ncbi:hypothetical protein DUNSADRAFT_283 [Dunaliella salina]|uniref:Encoded protein n=1 Tax=Dunaliella salina TaxID=3046 RepID=A0ABQ7GYE5_DUNSA|nr:hypothetical protein DUNSADRAFT_283 [Dunaliella salina]|eukprot:KAF5839627.1 hypothetical protein DUNSADRAFT_283 [Dunaliella salina]
MLVWRGAPKPELKGTQECLIFPPGVCVATNVCTLLQLRFFLSSHLVTPALLVQLLPCPLSVAGNHGPRLETLQILQCRAYMPSSMRCRALSIGSLCCRALRIEGEEEREEGSPQHCCLLKIVCVATAGI